MSRSRKKTPISAHTTCRSEKLDKRIWHKRLRAGVRQALHNESELMPHVRDVSNPWDMPKDGKHYWDTPENYRK